MPVGLDLRHQQGPREPRSRPARPARREAWFYQGVFKIGQSKGSKPLTTLTMTGKLQLRRRQGERGGEEEEAPAVGQRQGQVPHQGQAQRGDGPRHELARRGPLQRHPDSVKKGKVAVQQFKPRKTIIVRAGQQYFAKR